MPEETPTPTEKKPIAISLKGRWSTGKDIEAVFAQHAQLAALESEYYLTFGQVQTPEGGPGSTEAEIRPVARVVLTEKTIQQLAKLLLRTVGTGESDE